MIITDRKSIITEEAGLPPTVQPHHSRPMIVPEPDHHVIQEVPDSAPLVIEYIQAAAVIMTPESSELLLAQEGPRGRQGDPGPAVAAITFSGNTMHIEYENGVTSAVPFTLTHIDGGTFV